MFQTNEEARIHNEIRQSLDSYVNDFVEMKKQSGNKVLLNFYDTCCEMIGSLSKVVFSSSPVKLSFVNGELSGKCVFTEQKNSSIFQGSFDKSALFGKSRIISKENMIQVKEQSRSESTYDVSLTTFEDRVRFYGTIPKAEFGSESISRMTVYQIEKNGITWELTTPVRYNRNIVKGKAEARFSNGCLKALVMNGYILFGKSTPAVLVVDGQEFKVQYISMDNDVITENGDVWRLDSDCNHIDKISSF